MKKNRVCIMACVLVFSFIHLGCPISDETTSDTSYTEADVALQNGSITQHFYFAKTIEGLQKAADDNKQTLNPPLKNATWSLNTENIDPAVTQAMAAKNADFCGTLLSANGNSYIIAYKKNGKNYYVTGYR